MVGRTRTGRPLGFSRVDHDSGHGLSHRIVSRAVAIGPFLAESGNGTVDDFGVGPGNGFVSQVQLVHGPGGEVFQENIGPFHDFHDGLMSFGVFQIDREAAFVPVEIREGRPPHRLAPEIAGGRLDLDHLGPHVGQEHGTGGAGDDLGEVGDLDSFEGQPGFVCLHVLRPPVLGRCRLSGS